MLDEIIIRSNADHIHITFVHGLTKLLLAIHPIVLMSLTESFATGIDILFKTSLSVDDTHQSYIRQLPGTLVIHLNSYHVMLPITYLYRLQKILLYIEITQHERSTTTLGNTRQELQRLFDISTLALWFEIQQLTDDIQDMLTTFFGGIYFSIWSEKNTTPILSLF